MPPVQRARHVLGATILIAEGRDKMTKDQARALRQQLVVGESPDWFKGTLVERMYVLSGFNELIADREAEIGRDGRLAAGLGYFGVLGLVVGNIDESRLPMNRTELMGIPQIVRQSERNPGVDRNVILDITVDREVQWLTGLVLRPDHPRITGQEG